MQFPTTLWKAEKNQLIALENAKQVILDVAKEFAGISGREYGLFEEYKTEDADYVMVIIGSAAGTAKEAVDELREEGKKVGVLKLRVLPSVPGRRDCRSNQKLQSSGNHGSLRELQRKRWTAWF